MRPGLFQSLVLSFDSTSAFSSTSDGVLQDKFYHSLIEEMEVFRAFGACSYVQAYVYSFRNQFASDCWALDG